MNSLIFSVFLLLSPVSHAGEPVAATCLIAEATPLLSKAMYTGQSKYTMSSANEKPTVITESINIDRHNFLKIEQRGCNNITIDFKLETKRVAKDNLALIKRATNILKQLHISPRRPAMTEAQLDEMATKIQTEAEKNKDKTELKVCLTGTTDACKVEVLVTSTPTTVEFHYVSLP
jgi:hypothetical protein